MNKYIDTIYEYKGIWDRLSRCGLKIIKKKDKTIIIATELYDKNPGTSITNWCTQLAIVLCKEYNIPFEKLIFIEHTPDIGSKFSFNDETFDLVKFKLEGDKLDEPEWQRLSKEDVDKILTE